MQAEWSEDDYLKLTAHTRRLLEFRDGHIEVVPMPTDEHQRIVLFLYRTVYAFLRTRTDGIVLVAPLRLRLRTGRYREPDLLVLLSAKDKRRGNQFWTGADLVLEVVSPDDPQRDLVEKRQEYAAAGIPEYWIVDPAAERISVLGLKVGVMGNTAFFREVWKRPPACLRGSEWRSLLSWTRNERMEWLQSSAYRLCPGHGLERLLYDRTTRL